MSDELVGKILAGRYRVLYPIAKGGMGAVFEAEDLRAQRRVALKVVRDEFLRDGVSLERFRREATISATVKSPSLVATLDLVLDHDPAFFVMELLDGPTLSELLAHADRLPWERAARIAIDVAEGLGALHAAGVVHRDLKPSNVMLVRESGGERAKIIDFGVIRVASIDGQESLTWTGNVVGTPAFMAPEQLEGAVVDARSDLYSLGLLVAKMVLGAHAAVRAPLDPSTTIDGWPADVPVALQTLVTAMIARSRDARPTSADAVSAAIGAILAERTTTTRDEPETPPDSSYGGYVGAPVARAEHGAQSANSPAIATASTHELPSTSSAGSPTIRAVAPRRTVAPAVVAVLLLAVASSVVTSALVTRQVRPAVAFVREDVVVPDRPSPVPLRFDQTAQGPRYTPLGTRLQFNFGGANDDEAARDVLPRIEGPLAGCVDLAAHTLGDAVVSVELTIDARGTVVRNERHEQMVGTNAEFTCVDRVLRAAAWPRNPESYSLRFVASSM
jgi:serine/threonine protein kinase